jgi:hexosaminidase
MFNKKHSSSISIMIVLSIVMIQLSCAPKTVSDINNSSLIPKPVAVTSTGDYFILKSGTDIYVKSGQDELLNIGNMLAGILRKSTGFELEVKTVEATPRKGIYLTLSDENVADLGEESYELNITGRLLTLTSRHPEGIFRGIQTIRQLLPPRIEMDSIQAGPWEIATGTVTDYPVYSYRGAMLDVSRHFFGVDDVYPGAIQRYCQVRAGTLYRYCTGN